MNLAGLMVHGLVGLVLVLSGGVKVVKSPAQIVANFTRWQLLDRIKLIGAGEMAAGILLAVPLTSPLGVLVASANWGGAITTHMIHREKFVAPAVLLLLTWAGAVLKNPALFGLG